MMGPHAQVTDSSIKGFFEEFRFLSNFHLCEVPVWEEGNILLVYPSSEHAYMAQKTDCMDTKRLFTSPDMSPKQARQMGQQIELKSNWEQLKWDAMLKVNTSKYTHNPELASALLSTGTKYLEETNWWFDTYWGVCEGVGENNLGKVLMTIRDALSQGRLS